jgi:hypothetical protein
MLDFHCAAHGVDHAGELGEQVIARRIDYATTMVLDQGGDHFTVGSESANGGFFIVPHETAVPGDVRAEDRRQLAFHPDGGRLVRHRFSFSEVIILLAPSSCQQANISANGNP